jgi:hypothetical protein
VSTNPSVTAQQKSVDVVITQLTYVMREIDLILKGLGSDSSMTITANLAKEPALLEYLRTPGRKQQQPGTPSKQQMKAVVEPDASFLADEVADQLRERLKEMARKMADLQVSPEF